MEESDLTLCAGGSERPRHSAVFAYALWIQNAPIVTPIAPVPDAQWQDAVGRRLLTPAETAARRRYFDRKARAGLAMCG